MTGTSVGGPKVATSAPFQFVTTATMNVSLGGCGLLGLEVLLPALGWILLGRRARPA